MYKQILLLILGLAIIELTLDYFPWNEPSFRQSDPHKHITYNRQAPCPAWNSKSFLKGIFKHSSRDMILEANITMKSNLPCRTWKSLAFRKKFLKESWQNMVLETTKSTKSVMKKENKKINYVSSKTGKSSAGSNNDGVTIKRISNKRSKNGNSDPIKKAKLLNMMRSRMQRKEIAKMVYTKAVETAREIPTTENVINNELTGQTRIKDSFKLDSLGKLENRRNNGDTLESRGIHIHPEDTLGYNGIREIDVKTTLEPYIRRSGDRRQEHKDRNTGTQSPKKLLIMEKSASEQHPQGSWENRRGYEESITKKATPSPRKNKLNHKRTRQNVATSPPKQRRRDREKDGKSHILFAVGILSKLSALDRRNAVRETWFTTCLERHTEMNCRFFTDEIRSSTENRELYIQERHEHQDLEYMPYRGGYNFALRLLWMFKWFTQHYNFDYFLRVDDDYFICMDRLLKELPHRPSPIYWGWIHCEPGIVRVDEGFMILSHDIIEEVLERVNTTLLCHPFGDQAVAHWMLESKLNITYFMDNKRIIHQEVTSYMGNKYLIPNICNRYLGLHGTYPEYMHKYWHLYTDQTNRRTYGRKYKTQRVVPFEDQCSHEKDFNFDMFDDPYYFQPKLCKYNPVFKKTDEPYEGRERQARNIDVSVDDDSVE